MGQYAPGSVQMYGRIQDWTHFFWRTNVVWVSSVKSANENQNSFFILYPIALYKKMHDIIESVNPFFIRS